MCIDLYQMARKTGLPPSKLAILKELAFHANDEARAWPSIRRLVEYTGWSRSTVNRCLVYLRENRLIHRDPSYRKRYRAMCYMVDRRTMADLIDRRAIGD